MSAFKGRYLVPISLVFLAFSAIYAKKRNFIFFLIFALAIAAIYLIFGRKKERDVNFPIVAVLLLFASLLACVRGEMSFCVADALCEKYSGEHTVRGYVVETVERTDYFSELVVRTESVDGESATFRISVVSEFDPDLERGDLVELDVNILPREDYLAENSYGEISEGLVALVRSAESIRLCDGEPLPTLALASLNSHLSSLLRTELGTKFGSLASALLLGNRELLARDTLRDFRRAGVYHMLALSGMHVAILIGLLEVLLRGMFVPKRARVIILAACSLLYVALTGFLLSACRAMLMLWAVYAAYLLGRRGDSMTALFASVSLIVLVSPNAVFDASLLLSFASTFGVIASVMIAGRLKKQKSPAEHGFFVEILLTVGRKIASAILTSVCVTVCTLPLIYIFFGEFSLATFISNLFMGAVCEIFMIFALAVLLLSRFTALAPLGSAVSAITNAIGSLMLETCSEISSWDGVVVSLEYFGVGVCTFILLISSLILFGIKLKRISYLGIPCLCFALVFSASVLGTYISRQNTVRAEYIEGDALVLSSNEKIYLCDASNGRGGALYDAVALAGENCFTEIDGVILTHYHSYHAVTLGRLCRDHLVRAVYLPIPQNEKELTAMRSVVRVLEEAGTDAYLFSAGEELDLLDGRLLISERAYGEGYAHPSVIISFSFGESKISLIERPTFGTHLENSGRLAEQISESNVVILGSDGRAPREEYSLFDLIPEDCEVYFYDFEGMELSDFDGAMSSGRVYFDVKYKKYDLK